MTVANRLLSGHLRFGHRDPGAADVGPVLVHQLAHVPGELGGGSRKTVAMGELVKCMPELRMLTDISTEFLQRLSSFAKNTVKLRASFGLGFCERHLYPAVGVDFAFA